jgi:hypothetical protein
MLYSPKLARRSAPTVQKEPVRLPVKPPDPPKPSDWGKLLFANSRRKEAWRPSAEWHQKHRELLSYIERNRRAQVALAAAEIASLELGIVRPDVRAWTGHEKEAEKKAGWVWGNKYEINICLNTEGCRSIALTSAHECKHVQQFGDFPNLTSEEREEDARTYQKEFEQSIFS